MTARAVQILDAARFEPARPDVGIVVVEKRLLAEISRRSQLGVREERGGADDDPCVVGELLTARPG